MNDIVLSAHDGDSRHSLEQSQPARMNYQDIIVLHPGHSLEDFPTDLPDEKAAGLLNAFAVAWHPSLLASAKSLPREHRADDPPAAASLAGRLVLIPPICDELVPSGWIEQARAEGATIVAGTSERGELLTALGQPSLPPDALDPKIVGDFLALGTCRLLLSLLTRRMHHFGEMDEGHLEREAVAAAESAVAGDLIAAVTHLRACFENLTEARERFYPVECYLIDMCLLIPRVVNAQLAALLAGEKPINVLATASDFEEILRERPELRDSFARGCEAGTVEVLGGEWQERPVPLLPLTSMLREFEIGYQAFQRNFSRAPSIWARRRYGFSTLLPQILHRLGYRGAMHVALDDGLYPDAEQSKIRWEGCDGSVVDATTRIPLAADGAATYLRFPSRMAESMQQDQTAAVVWARWPEVHTPFWEDFERIHSYGPVLGRFVTLRQFFDHTEDPGRLSKFEEREYLSPFFIQAAAAEERDPIGRFLRHFRRRAQFDSGAFLDSLASILCSQPVGATARLDLEKRIEACGPDLPPDEAACDATQTELDGFVDQAARRLGDVILHESSGGPGYLVLNSLSFDRTVTVELPRIETPPAVRLPVRGTQFDETHRHVTVDLPSCGYVWIPLQGPKAERAKGSPAMAEAAMIRNEFIEVYVNDVTGGIGKIKEFGRRPNRLSQQLAFRFPRERTVPAAEPNADEPERTYYSEMRCSSVTVTAKGPGLGEIVTAGTLVDPEDGSTLAEYKQTVRLWRGRPVIELDIELHPVRSPSGDPWSNYFASRFAWNDSAATLTRSVLGGAHAFQFERFESPHFLEIATESQRTTILNKGLSFHRKTGMRMVDSLLIVGGETSRRFHFGIAIDADYPMQPAMDALVAPIVLQTAAGPPAARRSGWLFHLDAKNVQILQIIPLKPIDSVSETSDAESPAIVAPPAADSSRGFGLRLVETEGRHRPVQIRCFRTPTSARTCDFRGRTLSVLKIIDDAVLLEMTGYEIVDVELRFDELVAAVHS